MHVANLALREIGGGDVEAVALVFLDEADHHVDIFAGGQKLAEDRIAFRRPAGDGWHQVLKYIAGQR